MPSVKIPAHVKSAAKIVMEWISEVQGKYDPNLTGDLNEYYDSVQTIAEEDELEFYTREDDEE